MGSEIAARVQQKMFGVLVTKKGASEVEYEITGTEQGVEPMEIAEALFAIALRIRAGGQGRPE